jgi:hypothetical protein
MFAAAENPLLPHRVVERTRQSHHLVDSLAVAAAPQRIIGLIIEGDVENRTEIEIEPEEAQEPTGYFPMAPDEFEIVPVAQLLRIRRLVSDEPEARDAASLLIDRDDRLDFAEVAQVID